MIRDITTMFKTSTSRISSHSPNDTLNLYVTLGLVQQVNPSTKRFSRAVYGLTPKGRAIHSTKNETIRLFKTWKILINHFLSTMFKKEPNK